MDRAARPPRNRSAGVVIKDGALLVMRRVNRGHEYYAFPGGGQEAGETPEQTAAREIEEETTVKVAVSRLLYHVSWDTGEENFFYLCEYLSGEPRLAVDSEEYAATKGGEQVYEPMWAPLADLPKLRLYQLEVRDLLIEDLKRGLPAEPRELFIKLSERRQ